MKLSADDAIDHRLVELRSEWCAVRVDWLPPGKQRPYPGAGSPLDWLLSPPPLQIDRETGEIRVNIEPEWCDVRVREAGILATWPLSETDIPFDELQSFYRDRAVRLAADGKHSSREEDRAALIERFGTRITHKTTKPTFPR